MEKLSFPLTAKAAWIGPTEGPQPSMQQGIKRFVPYFIISLNYAGATNALATYSNTVDGLFYWAAGTAQTVTNVNQAWGLACRQSGKLFMGGYSPNYWGCAQANRSYIENQGGAGTTIEWQSIIQQQPDWIEISTWNDYNESTYVCPVDNPGTYTANLASPQRYSHAGFLELAKHYIAWYKTGQEPAINQDALFYFYRIHSTNAVATNDTPVTVFKGNVQDVIYATTALTAPAQLEITSGTNHTHQCRADGDQPAGRCLCKFPAHKLFNLKRNGITLISVQGSNILSQIQLYDYFQSSGFVYAPQPPSYLQVVPPPK